MIPRPNLELDRERILSNSGVRASIQFWAQQPRFRLRAHGLIQLQVLGRFIRSDVTDRIKFVVRILTILGLLLLGACGGGNDGSSIFGSGGGDAKANKRLKEHAGSIEGIYSLDSFTRNEDGCDAGGASALDDIGDHTRLVAVLGEVFGFSTLDVYSCVDEADCRDIVAILESRMGGFGIQLHFSFGEADDADHYSGGVAWTGSEREEGVCSGGRVEEHSMERDGDSLSIENRIIPSNDYPSEDGVCWSDDSMAAAKGQPCTELEVVEATFLEAI